MAAENGNFTITKKAVTVNKAFDSLAALLIFVDGAATALASARYLSS